MLQRFYPSFFTQRAERRIQILVNHPPLRRKQWSNIKTMSRLIPLMYVGELVFGTIFVLAPSAQPSYHRVAGVTQITCGALFGAFQTSSPKYFWPMGPNGTSPLQVGENHYKPGRTGVAKGPITTPLQLETSRSVSGGLWVVDVSCLQHEKTLYSFSIVRFGHSQAQRSWCFSQVSTIWQRRTGIAVQSFFVYGASSFLPEWSRSCVERSNIMPSSTG